MASTRKIPAAAFRFAGDVKAGEGTEAVPLAITALGGDVIDRGFFRIVQDLSGMQVRPRIALDWCHSTDLIGYAEKFETASGTLTCQGVLTPSDANECAQQVVANMRAGIPHQASIDFSPTKTGECVIEDVPEGVSTQVNGKTFTGPLMVVRKWTLHRLAICPSGADSDTAAMLQASQKANEYEVTMSEPAAPAPVPETPAAPDPRAEFKTFVAAFGQTAGAAYFAEGLDMIAAQAKHQQSVVTERDALRSRVSELEAQLAALQAAPKPPAFDPGADAGGDLWAQYAAIKDPAEKTKFYRLHKSEMGE